MLSEGSTWQRVNYDLTIGMFGVLHHVDLKVWNSTRSQMVLKDSYKFLTVLWGFYGFLRLFKSVFSLNMHQYCIVKCLSWHHMVINIVCWCLKKYCCNLSKGKKKNRSQTITEKLQVRKFLGTEYSFRVFTQLPCTAVMKLQYDLVANPFFLLWDCSEFDFPHSALWPKYLSSIHLSPVPPQTSEFLQHLAY